MTQHYVTDSSTGYFAVTELKTEIF